MDVEILQSHFVDKDVKASAGGLTHALQKCFEMLEVLSVCFATAAKGSIPRGSSRGTVFHPDFQHAPSRQNDVRRIRRQLKVLRMLGERILLEWKLGSGSYIDSRRSKPLLLLASVIRGTLNILSSLRCHSLRGTLVLAQLTLVLLAVLSPPKLNRNSPNCVCAQSKPAGSSCCNCDGKGMQRGTLNESTASEEMNRMTPYSQFSRS